MKTHLSIQKLLGAIVTVMLLGMGSNAYAITLSGDTVSNSATVNFDVASVAQEPITSTAHTFTVDTRVDHIVAQVANDNVGANATLQPLEFTVTNTGNAVQDYLLSTENSAGDDFDPSSIAIYVEAANAGFNSTDDTLISTLDNIAVGASATVYIVSTIPGTATNIQTSVVHLIAQARAATGGTQLTEDSDGDLIGGAAEIVFATAVGVATGDVLNDDVHSASATYTVLGANISVTKSSSVTDDAGGSYHIPGATVTYTITISNGAGAETATGIKVEDLLDVSTLTYVAGTLKVQAPNFYANVQTTLSDTAGNDEGDYDGTTSSTITVTGIDLAATESATVVFDVTID